jgi:hypothetical protein
VGVGVIVAVAVGVAVTVAMVGGAVGVAVGVTVGVGVAVAVDVDVTVGNQVGQGSTGQGIGMQPPVGQVESTVIGTDFALQPQLLQTVSVAVYSPALIYSWVGFFRVDVPPSPNTQDQLTTFGEDLSVKLTVREAFPDIGSAAKSATGGVFGMTVTCFEMVD